MRFAKRWLHTTLPADHTCRTCAAAERRAFLSDGRGTMARTVTVRSAMRWACWVALCSWPASEGSCARMAHQRSRDQRAACHGCAPRIPIATPANKPGDERAVHTPPHPKIGSHSLTMRTAGTNRPSIRCGPAWRPGALALRKHWPRRIEMKRKPGDSLGLDVASSHRGLIARLKGVG